MSRIVAAACAASAFHLAVAAFALSAAPALSASVEETEAPRQRLSLDSGWHFRFGKIDQTVTKAGFDDSGWSQVDVPHSWNRLGSYDAQRTPETNVDKGEGWYRRHLMLPAAAKGRVRFLEFDGVGAVAEVWVNGTSVGRHAGAFGRFRFDVTRHLKAGDNLIVVKADNSAPAPGSTTADLIPLGGDFFIYGGLYRGVSLVETGATHIDLLDHGGPGVYISTPRVAIDSADVAVLTRLRDDGRGGRVVIGATLLDADGKVVAQSTQGANVPAGRASEVRQTLTLTLPKLWQGRADPYLYRAVVEVRRGNRVLDRVEQTFGVRSFVFDPDKGLILNGTPVRLHGASRHQDRAGKGWALSAGDHAEDMAIMAEMGVNTVRHAHYQHAQQWSDEADRNGMVVWAELPFVHQSSLTNDLPTPALIDNAKSQLLELIRQNYNHPSIMIWSVGNEIDIEPSIKRLSKPAQSADMLKQLDALARAEDPTRPTSYADCCEGTAIAIKGSQVLSDIAQVAGYNRYFGWYYSQPDVIGRALGGFHAKYPRHPITLSEYGAGGAFTQHTDNPLGGPIAAGGRPHPEEYQSWVHEQTWKALKPLDFLAASWIWNMFDFGSTSREEGEAFDLNDKGLVSFDRKRRKDAYYFYKANWSKDPVLYLTSRRYTDRAYPVVTVRAYSNADQAVLTLNGRRVKTASCPDRICEWPAVVLDAGQNILAVSAEIDGKPVSDQISWTAPDRAKGLHIAAGTLTGMTVADGTRFGSDDFFAGGTGKSLSPAVFGVRKTAAIEVATERDPELYRSYREGTFSYDLPLPDGVWTVELRFVEPDAAKASSRTFDVAANGKTILAAYNPASAVGGALKAASHRFRATMKGGHLKLDFIAKGGDALVSAITVTPVTTRPD